MSQPRVGILTLGCRVNLYESTAIAEALEAKGFAVEKAAGAKTPPCDFYIVNTCSVTAESHRQSGQTVRRCASMGKTAVLGCASQKDEKYFSSIPNVFYVGGSRNKMDVVSALTDMTGNDPELPYSCALRVLPMEDAKYEAMNVRGSGEKPIFSSCRAFVKIQDGCSSRCSYCIIPALRGPSRSRKADEILAEVDRLADAGFSEIIMTGISVSSFGDHGFRLPDLIREMGKRKEKGILRVRFGSVSPFSVTEDFLEAAAASPNFMPHIHLSLQSGSDRILHLMRRTYAANDAMERIRALRKAIPDIELSADFITGFPTETEEDYRMTESFAKEADLLHVHAFPYSEREGTEAAEMEGKIPKEIRKERCVRLNLVSDALRSGRMQRKIGKTVVMLTEKTGRGKASGHTEEFMECAVQTENARVGDCLTVRVTSEDGKYLTGRVLY